MNISIEPREDHQVKIIAEFDADLFGRFKRQAARKISQEAKISGFRPGKAPYDVVRRLYGDDTISKEAVELIIDDQYPEVLKQADIKPYGPGSLEEIITYDPPKLAFLVPLSPEVEIGDYRSVRIEYTPESVTEEDVDGFIRNLQANFSKAEAVERPAEKGDLIFLRLSGEILNPDEGVDKEYIKERPRQVIIGENPIQPDDWPFDGFSQELLGMTAGEEKTLIHDFSPDEIDEKIKGKQVSFNFTVESVKSMVIPEVNDEFAREKFKYENLEEMRQEIRKDMGDAKNSEYDKDYIERVIDEILTTSKVKYPPQMLEEEIEHTLHHFEESLERQKMDLETYLKTIEKEKQVFIDEEVKPAAIKHLERSLVVEKISSLEKVKVDPAELQKETQNHLQQYTEWRVPRPKGMSNDEFVRAVMIDTATEMINHATTKLIKSIANGTYVEKSETEEVSTEATQSPSTENTAEEETVANIESAEATPVTGESTDAPAV